MLLKGLHRLEYRGYDSAGVAMIAPSGSLNVYKTRGKVDDLDRFCESKDTAGSIGIAGPPMANPMMSTPIPTSGAAGG